MKRKIAETAEVEEIGVRVATVGAMKVSHNLGNVSLR
jgi:hypothetical protein